MVEIPAIGREPEHPPATAVCEICKVERVWKDLGRSFRADGLGSAVLRCNDKPECGHAARILAAGSADTKGTRA